MMTTRLPAAKTDDERPRNCMAKWMPFSSRPGTGRSRGCSAPPARLLCAAREQHGLVVAPQIFDWDVAADVGIGNELDSLGAHLLQTPVDVVLLHLEIRDAVAQQATDAVVLFEHSDGMSRTAQLLGGGKPCGTGADYGDELAGELVNAAPAESSLRRKCDRHGTTHSCLATKATARPDGAESGSQQERAARSRGKGCWRGVYCVEGGNHKGHCDPDESSV